MGGYFTSKEWTSEKDDPTKTRRAYALAWGWVIRETSEKSAASGHYRIFIKYRTNRFIQVEAWNDSPAAQVIKKIEHGDYVLVFGTFVRRWAETKKAKKRGEKGVWIYSINAEFVITTDMIVYLLRLFTSRWLNKQLDAEDSVPDVFEYDE